MFVITVAFGKAYIDRFFSLALYSLMNEDNLPAIHGETLTLLVATVDEDVPLVREWFETKNVRAVFGSNVECISLCKNRLRAESGDHLLAPRIGYHLVMEMAHAVMKTGESFMFCFSDNIYARGSASTAWSLHKLTGKIVTQFNGRVVARENDPDFYQSCIAERYGVMNTFLSDKTPNWHAISTSNQEALNLTDYSQKMIVNDDSVYIFSSVHSPFVGKFQPEDIAILLEGGMLGAWDHIWGAYLTRTNRMMPQTNLNLGMSIEPDTIERAQLNHRRTEIGRRETRLNQNRYLTLLRDFGDPELALRQYSVERGDNRICFSGSLRR
jgi:hypothetical protein